MTIKLQNQKAQPKNEHLLKGTIAAPHSKSMLGLDLDKIISERFLNLVC